MSYDLKFGQNFVKLAEFEPKFGKKNYKLWLTKLGKLLDQNVGPRSMNWQKLFGTNFLGSAGVCIFLVFPAGGGEKLFWSVGKYFEFLPILCLLAYLDG